MADNNIKKSCYMELKEFYDNNNGELYSFQDFYKAGNMEYKAFTKRTKPLDLFKKNRTAQELIKLLFLSFQENRGYIKVENFININPIINYYESLRNALKAAIEEDLENKELLESYVKDIIFNSNNKELIKFAIVAAQVLKLEKLDEILNIFSIHNDFLFYVLNDYCHMEGYNERIFEIAKGSKSYGKVFALAALNITNNHMEDWVVEKGWIDDYDIPEITQHSILSVDLLEYLNRTKFDLNKIEEFSQSFSVMISEYGLSELKDKIAVCKKFLGIVDEVGGGIYTMYVVVSMLYCVDGIIVDYYKENKNIESFKDYEDYKTIIELCTDICMKKYWNDVIDEAVNNIEIEGDILITCIEKIGYKLKKKEYETLLKRDYSSPLIYKYGLCAGNKAIRKSAFKLGVKNLPINDMTTGADELSIENLTYDDLNYICIYVIVKYAQLEDFDSDINEYKDIMLTLLQCSLIEAREECVKNLKKLKNSLNESEKEYIYDCIEKECVPRIKRGLKSLIHIENDNQKKKTIIRSIEKVRANPRDAFLIDLELLGEESFERFEVQHMIVESNMVYMAENVTDDDYEAVVCLGNGYAIGYIEKPIDDIVVNMIRSGKYVYGKIKEVDDDLSSIKISLYLSYMDVANDVSNTLSLLTKDKGAYIQ